MSKSIRFTNQDKELIKRIEIYQKKNKTTFIGAVRSLLVIALDLEKVITKIK